MITKENFINAILRDKVFLSATLVFSLILGISISLIAPSIFRSNIKLLPPQQSQSTASALLNQVSGLTGGSASLGMKNPNDQFIGILKSRTVFDSIIEKFELQKRYKKTFIEDARDKLESRVSITTGKDGIISLDVEDQDPVIAAKIATSFAETLTDVVGKFSFTEASQRRIFFEKQLQQTRSQIAKLEDSLSGAITSKGIASAEIQGKAAFETIAKLRYAISAKEVQLNTIARFQTNQSYEHKRIESELASMRAELALLENGEKKEFASENNKASNTEGAIATFRDLKYYQTLYESLAKQFELARLDEAKDAPLIQILDKASISEKPVRPKKMLIIFGFLAIGIIISLLRVFIKNKELFNQAK